MHGALTAAIRVYLHLKHYSGKAAAVPCGQQGQEGFSYQLMESNSCEAGARATRELCR